MKRTVAAIAMGISTPSFALMLPAQATKVICLDTFESEKGVKYAGNCDQAANNEILEATILENGCAADQIALTSVAYPVAGKKGKPSTLKYDIEIKSCLPPNVVQL